MRKLALSLLSLWLAASMALQSQTSVDWSQIKNKPAVSTFAWSRTPGGSVSVGSNTKTVLCPRGLATSRLAYVSGGTGTAELATITGGTCVTATPPASGTIIFTAANTHSGAYTVQTATAGWQEAAQAAGTGGSAYFTAGTYTLRAQFVAPFDNQTYFGDSPDLVTIQPANATNLNVLVNLDSRSRITVDSLGFDGNFKNQTYTGAAENNGISAASSAGITIKNSRFHAFGYSSVTDAPYANLLFFNNARDCRILNNQFYSNWAFEMQLLSVDGCAITGNTYGKPSVSDSLTNSVYWDTYSGGLGPYIATSTDITYSGNRMYGSFKTSTYSFAGTCFQSQGINGGTVSGNYCYGVGNSIGTLSVTNASGSITGTNTTFVAADVGKYLWVEGDSTQYKITARASDTSITVTPVMSHGTASGLRYEFQNSGDLITVGNSSRVIITGNTSYYSGDHGMNVGVNAPGNTAYYNIISNNLVAYAQTCGLELWGGSRNSLITSNLFIDNDRNTASGRDGAICLDWDTGFADSNYNFFGDNSAQGEGGGSATQKYLFWISSANASHLLYNALGRNFLGGGTGLYNPATASLVATIFNTPDVPAVTSTFANLGGLYIPPGSGIAPPSGSRVWCYDCKNVKDNAATAGAACANSGSGAWAYYVNSGWACN